MLWPLASPALAQSTADSRYRMQDAQTRWISPENPTGASGAGGTVNKGAKGAAFIVVAPGASADLANIAGAGIVHRIWMSGTIPRRAWRVRATASGYPRSRRLGAVSHRAAARH